MEMSQTTPVNIALAVLSPFSLVYLSALIQRKISSTQSSTPINYGVAVLRDGVLMGSRKFMIESYTGDALSAVTGWDRTKCNAASVAFTNLVSNKVAAPKQSAVQQGVAPKKSAVQQGVAVAAYGVAIYCNSLTFQNIARGGSMKDSVLLSVSGASLLYADSYARYWKSDEPFALLPIFALSVACSSVAQVAIYTAVNAMGIDNILVRNITTAALNKIASFVTEDLVMRNLKYSNGTLEYQCGR